MRQLLSRLQVALFVSILALTIVPRAYPEQPTPSGHAPIEVHLSQSGESAPLWLKIVEGVIWPIIVLASVILFRAPLLRIAHNIALGGGELSIGGLAVKIPKLESELRTQNETIVTQQAKIDEQNVRIQNLIKYSMSVFIYGLLCDLKKAKERRWTYIYREDGSMYQNLRFLIDHGYIQEVHGRPNDGDDLCPLVVITPSGEDVIALRSS